MKPNVAAKPGRIGYVGLETGLTPPKGSSQSGILTPKETPTIPNRISTNLHGGLSHVGQICIEFCLSAQGKKYIRIWGWFG